MPDTLGERLKAWRLLAEGLKSRLGEVEFLTADPFELRFARSRTAARATSHAKYA